MHSRSPTHRFLNPAFAGLCYGQPPPGYGQGGYATGNGNGGSYHPQVEGHTPHTAPHTAQSQAAQGARQALYHGYHRAYPNMGASMPGGTANEVSQRCLMALARAFALELAHVDGYCGSRSRS